MNSIWFPDRKTTDLHEFMVDSVQTDLGNQAKLNACVDLNCTQLTGGSFKGRVFSAHLGDMTIHIESINLAIELDIAASPHKFSFCIALKENPPLESYGVVGATDIVNILPPGGGVVAIAPPDSLLLVFSIGSHALLDNAGLCPEIAHWLMALSRHGAMVKAPQLASRLRANIASALESSSKLETPKKRTIMDQAVIFSIASALTMEWLGQRGLPIFRSTPAYERFRHVRNLLLNDVESFTAQADGALGHLGSKRSIEQAFAEHVFMGPLAYARIIRLHNARRKLLEAAHRTKNIGDIAAQEGFWDASRFAAYYRKHFGELPSATRQRWAEI